MSVILRFLFSCFQSNIFLFLGMSLGLSASFLLLYFESNNEVEFLPHIVNKDNIYDHRVKLNVKNKPQKPKKPPRPFVRPRYYATELGIKDRLFVGVLTSQEYLHTRAVAINQTLAHLVDRVRYFVTIPSGIKPNISLPGIVGFTRIKRVLEPFHALKYVVDHYLDTYDFFYFVKDLTFINARQLNQLVWNLSISQDIHLGAPSEIKKYCSLDGGILLSNSIVRTLKGNLDWCVKNAFSESDDKNFGLCIFHASTVPCSNVAQAKRYIVTEVPENFHTLQDAKELFAERDFNSSVTVYPMYDFKSTYMMYIYFSSNEMTRIDKEIQRLRGLITETTKNLPQNLSKISWPIGAEGQHKSKNRFEFVRWTHFNETSVFFDDDFTVVEPLLGSRKMEVDFVTRYAIRDLSEKYGNKIKFVKLINGFWKFDAMRGVDYMLDLLFISNYGAELVKSVELCRPLGKVEILPVPYVTENSRIHMITIVDEKKKFEAMKFLDQYEQTCLQKKDKVSLTMIFLYDPESTLKGETDVFDPVKQRISALSENYDRVQAKITWIAIRLPVAFKSIEIEPLLRIAVLDLCLKKYSPDNLILVAETRMELKTECLNRVRMNTIVSFQIFSPIPFVEYHPKIAYLDTKGKDQQYDIHRYRGRFDNDDYSVISFYVQDYLSARKSVASRIPVVRTDREIADLLKLSSTNTVASIFEMFTTDGNVHIFRAVEPALKFRYKEFTCTGTKSNSTIRTCTKQKLLQLGTKSQLARLKLEYDAIHKN